MKNRIATSIFVFILSAVPLLPSMAQQGPKWDAVGADAATRALSRHLLEAVRDSDAGLRANEIVRRHPLLRGEGGQVVVDLRLDALSEQTLRALEARGLEVSSYSFDHARVEGSCAVSALAGIAALQGVRTIHPAYGFVTASGSAWTQADSTLRAPRARSEFGVDGSGVSVGILSDSFNDVIGGSISGASCSRVLTGSAPQLSGDLPASVAVLHDGAGGGTDEGAAMAEIIHDVAPGANLMFHAASTGILDFAAGIDALKSCGADVIVDDVLYFAEPMFQDGPIAQAARSAVQDGVAYFTAAGNLGTHGISETFSDANPADDLSFPPSGKDFHRFADGDEYATVTVPAGCGFRAILQWAEPFDGTLGNGASSDYDLYRCSSENPASCLPMDGSVQGCSSPYGGGDPIEMGVYTNTGSTATTIHLAVDQYCGNDVPFRLVVVPECGGGFQTDADVFTGPQIYGHAAVPEVATVGAVFFGEADEGGSLSGDPSTIDPEGFSSVGGELVTYFDATGGASAQQVTSKPDMAAPHGGNTTFFGSDLAYDADGLPNFTGTSAAAAHAAGVAALLMEYDPTLAPDVVKARMAVNAIDVGDPGFDFRSGNGLIDALNTLGDAVLPVTLTAFDAAIDGNRVLLTWSAQAEENLQGYEIEHRDGHERAFSSIGWRAGRGSGQYSFVTDEAEAGTHRFRLRMVDTDGSFTYSPEVEVFVGTRDRFELSAAYPDPFHDVATMRLAVARSQHVEVNLFDVAGRLVSRLYSGTVASDAVLPVTVSGSAIPSGLYFVRAEGEYFSAVSRVTVVK